MLIYTCPTCTRLCMPFSLELGPPLWGCVQNKIINGKHPAPTAKLQPMPIRNQTKGTDFRETANNHPAFRGKHHFRLSSRTCGVANSLPNCLVSLKADKQTQIRQKKSNNQILHRHPLCLKKCIMALSVPVANPVYLQHCSQI